MGVWSKICAVLAWILFVVSLFYQCLLILTFWMPPFFASLFPGGGVTNETNTRALPFLVIGTVLFTLGFLLLRFLKKRRWLWTAATVAGALILAGVGLYLRVQYPETIVSEGVYAGYYSMAKLVTRHMLPLGAALLMGIAAFLKKKQEDKRLLQEALQDVEDYKPRFQ